MRKEPRIHSRNGHLFVPTQTWRKFTTDTQFFKCHWISIIYTVLFTKNEHKYYSITSRQQESRPWVPSGPGHTTEQEVGLGYPAKLQQTIWQEPLIKYLSAALHVELSVSSKKHTVAEKKITSLVFCYNNITLGNNPVSR